MDEKLSVEYAKYVEALSQSYAKFLDILTVAFSANAEVAFTGSIELALKLGVPAEDVLDSHAKVVSYFTE